MNPTRPLLCLALTCPLLAQEVDVDFDDLTPASDVDLIVVRENAIGAGGIDLASYGMPGVHDFVQSIYIRAQHDGTAFDVRGLRGRLRFFAGLPMEETAKALGISLRQAERDWTMARTWLKGRIEGEI